MRDLHGINIYWSYDINISPCILQHILMYSIFEHLTLPSSEVVAQGLGASFADVAPRFRRVNGVTEHDWIIMTLIFPKPKVSSCRFCVTPFCYCHQKTVILEVRSTSYHRCECWPTGIAISGGKAPVNRVAAGVLCARLAYVSHGWIGWFSLLWLHAAVLSLLKWQVFSQGKMKQLVATNSTSVFWTYSFNNVTWCDLDLDIQLRNRMLTHWFAKNWVWDDVNCCS